MGNVKRVLLFSPNPNTREELENLVMKYFSVDFRLFHNEVIMQKFESIHESYRHNAQIGIGGEILVVFDSVPLETHVSRVEKENLKVLLKAEKRLCDDKKIPYIDYYKNQILRREMLDDLRKQFYSRLEANDFFKY